MTMIWRYPAAIPATTASGVPPVITTRHSLGSSAAGVVDKQELKADSSTDGST